MLIGLRDQKLLIYREVNTTGDDHYPQAEYQFVCYAWGRISTPSGKEIELAEATEQKINAVISFTVEDAQQLTVPHAIVLDPVENRFYRLNLALSQRLHSMVKFIASYIAEDQTYTLVGP